MVRKCKFIRAHRATQSILLSICMQYIFCVLMCLSAWRFDEISQQNCEHTTHKIVIFAEIAQEGEVESAFLPRFRISQVLNRTRITNMYISNLFVGFICVTSLQPFTHTSFIGFFLFFSLTLTVSISVVLFYSFTSFREETKTIVASNFVHSTVYFILFASIIFHIEFIFFSLFLVVSCITQPSIFPHFVRHFLSFSVLNLLLFPLSIWYA